MQVLENVWLFFQDQIWGMKWMNVLIGNGVSAVGIDMESKVGVPMYADTVGIIVVGYLFNAFAFLFI